MQIPKIIINISAKMSRNPGVKTSPGMPCQDVQGVESGVFTPILASGARPPFNLVGEVVYAL